MNPYTKSWRTTLAGVGAILAALGDIVTQFATKSWDMTRLGADLTGICTGIGLIMAKDAVVSTPPGPPSSTQVQ